MQYNHELLDLLVTNDVGACVFLLNLWRLHMIIRISPANRSIFFFIFLLALHWNTCVCVQDIAYFILALLIWNSPDFYPGLDGWLSVGCGQPACQGFVLGVVEVPFGLVHLDLQQLPLPCWGLRKVSRENKASVRISEYSPLVCNF